MNAPSFLQTPRLYLRSLVSSDIDGSYVNWFNDEEVCQFNGHHIFPYHREEALTYITHIASSHTELVLAIIQRGDERHIGNISLGNIDSVYRSAEFAILIGERDCWGKGYAKEAAQTLILHGFNSLNLHRIYCGTSVDNVPMQKLASALKMKQEGLRREAMFKNGRYLDVIEYGVLRMEYFG